MSSSCLECQPGCERRLGCERTGSTRSITGPCRIMQVHEGRPREAGWPSGRLLPPRRDGVFGRVPGWPRVCRESGHCKKSWRKTPPAWPDVTDSLVRGTENFFNMKIELTRWVPTTKTEYFEIIGISRWFFVLPQRSFPTIFRQLSDEWIIKSRTSGTWSSILQVYNPLLYHCATLSLCELVWQHYFFTFSILVYFLNTCLPSSVLCFPSSVLC